MPEFQNPSAFFLLLLVPLLFVLRRLKFFSRLSFRYTIADWNGKVFGWNVKLRNFMFFFSEILFVLGYSFMVAALAEPVVYTQERVYTSRGTDVVFVLDISPSMAARDFSGSRRIDVSKKAISDIVRANGGVSYGLVTMALEASVSVPPTMDHEIFLQRLNDTSIGSLGDGTALGTGICTAVYHLASSSAPKKCIVLVTDGENNAGAIHPETASALAARNGITVYSLGVGTAGSAPIDYVDIASGKTYSGYLNSSFDPDSLKAISQVGGGRYFEVRSLNDLFLALNVISRNEGTAQSYHTRTTAKNYYESLLMVTIVLATLGLFIRRIYLQEYI